MKQSMFFKMRGVFILAAIATLATATAFAGTSDHSRKSRMSALGARAAAAVARIQKKANATQAPSVQRSFKDLENLDLCVNTDDDCEDGLSESAPGGQAEVSIAVDKTGKHVVIGFNDTRGFALNPLSVSGFMYSEDGGKSFVDGGQLPSPGNSDIGGTKLPQVFGDPEVKYLGDCTFVYASIVVDKFSATTAVQTMGIHRSTDCGKTWTGPFVVPAASNPNGGVTAGEPDDAADKEFMDVDPETGRLIISWSNFTPVAPGGVEIRTAFTDNAKSGAPPTWSAGTVVAATEDDGQGSIPRFARGSKNAYVAWVRFPFPGVFAGFGNNIGFARSTDNGATWSTPINLTDEFFTMDQVLGNDRVNTSPSLAVDNSFGRNRGNVYVVYANDNNGDGSDIYFQKSTDDGKTFSKPISINAGPGQDRAQWFPWITVDDLTGRVHVFYYDQGIDKTGDLTEVSYVFSDDAGKHWSAPVPLTRRPFHAGHGNDTGQPNLGDYVQGIAHNGDLFASYAVANRPPRGFVDGQPTLGNMTVPDIEFKRVDEHSRDDVNSLPLSINVNGVAFSDSGGNGFIDPGEFVRVRIPLTNYTVNEISDSNATVVRALLSTDTAGVDVIQAVGIYGLVRVGATDVPVLDYVLKTSTTFKPGALIELKLRVEGAVNQNPFARATLAHTLFSGTPVATPLLSENFNGVAPGVLPAGWTTAHGGGINIVPWTSRNNFCGSTSNAAFHQNANDNGAGNPTRFERLFSPAFVVPADTDYVTVEFDICTDTEDDPNFKILAYDGFLLRVLDATTGNTLRSVLVEAFEDEFTTGAIKHYPKHFPRSGNPAYFQDMSAWAGDSHGPQHVKLRLPGMAGTTAQLRFEYTQDGAGTCLDVGGGPVCGVQVDNIVVNSVKSTAQAH